MEKRAVFALNKSVAGQLRRPAPRSKKTHGPVKKQPLIISSPINSVSIASRVFVLGTDEMFSVQLIEFSYVDLAKNVELTPGAAKADARPFWVPDFIPKGNWSMNPACYWRSNTMMMLDFEMNPRLPYNALADYSLELIRWYRPDLFDSLFQRFTVRSKWGYTDSQLAMVKDSIRPDWILVDDFDANFSPNSPAAFTLKNASMDTDLLPLIDHYMCLFAVRAFSMRLVFQLIR